MTATEIRPFEVKVPDADLADLRARLEATRWTGDVFDADWRFGAPIPFVKSLCGHWCDRFDWRALEARINREASIVTEIDGLTIHCVHRRSARSDAIPLVLLHGWPGSFLEFLDLYEPLAAPPADEAAFHVVTPSLPGYGFSTTALGVTPQNVAAIVTTLMARLGYDRFMIQGGNWGSLIGTEIARQRPDRVIALHLSSINGSPPPDRAGIPLTQEEQSWLADHASFPHFALFSQRPASATHALNDSPAGLAAFVAEKFHDWADNRGAAESALSPDRMLATIALYWFTKSIGTSVMLYYEMMRDMPKERFVSTPTAVAVFQKSIVKIPRAWAERHYNIAQWTVFDRGGHFAAMEAPDLLVRDLRLFAGLLAAR